MIYIDINSDVGEGINNEDQLMPLISSCNIACGGHTGDEATMKKVIGLAAKHDVHIGAHPSYPDRENFGRKVIHISSNTLKESIQSQILKLKQVCETQGQKLHHVKPHGALYNQAAIDIDIAQTVIDATLAIDKTLLLYVPYNSVIARLAQGQLPCAIEGFADRNYNPDYTLVSRHSENALITKPVEVLSHIIPMIKEQKIVSVTGDKLPLYQDTICVHGDTSTAIDILKYLHENLRNHNIGIS